MKQTLKAWAKELRVDPATLEKRVRKAGFAISPKKLWGARDIFTAWTGDKEVALTRQALALAEKMERENAEGLRELIPRAEATEFIRTTFGAVREMVVGMPVVLASRVNPTDPTHARGHLDEWVNLFIRHCREQVPPGLDVDPTGKEADAGE